MGSHVLILSLLFVQVLLVVVGAVVLLTRRIGGPKHQDEFSKNREEYARQSRLTREELQTVVKQMADSVLKMVSEFGHLQKKELETLSKHLMAMTQSNEQKMEKVRETVESKLQTIQVDNTKKLEQMRQTVDEKLNATLEKRLGDTFKIVSERLELVHKGLGEMQTLATGVGDLKKVLTNVKTRGTWGEIQLGSLLEQVLTADQYQANVATKSNSAERVEFAICLPGKDEDDQKIWLPIDAKFPQETYIRLIEARERGDVDQIEDAGKRIESEIKTQAQLISQKYISPPQTTDFGILFLPIEGLYAEVVGRTGLVEQVQAKYRIMIAGPTTLAALLNSLQMGFRTLAIQKRSSEVWTLLGAVKSEFGKFGGILDKTQKKLQEASNTIETAARKSRTIERKLNKVQDLPTDEPQSALTNPEETALFQV